MGDFLYEDKVKEMFGERKLLELKVISRNNALFNEIFRDEKPSDLCAVRKQKIVKAEIDRLKAGNLVKFIAVTGSVAAGLSKEDDDIDVFVVVKDYRVWLYRFLIWLKNFRSKLFRRQSIFSHTGRDVKDTLCMNLLVEERGLHFDSDVFNLHELYYMVPIFNENYRDYVLMKNDWLVSKFGLAGVTSGYLPEKDSFTADAFLRIMNFLAMLGQLLFMILHKPNYGRLLKNYQKGRIEFYPENFKKEKLCAI